MACRPRPTPIQSPPTGSPVVHNGIIENFQALRHELTALGYTFGTETDTEAVAILATYFLAQGLSPPDAVAKTLARLDGAFALAFLFAGEHDLLIRKDARQCRGGHGVRRAALW
jgi:glucosamine 6-phosphate synthetase-like amidotransferase/phosphosugar isomerase protein